MTSTRELTGHGRSRGLAASILIASLLTVSGPWSTGTAIGSAPAEAGLSEISVDSISTLRAFGGLSSIALNAAGNPVIAYQAYDPFDLGLVVCNDADCKGDDEVIRVGSGSTAGPWPRGLRPRMVLDRSGNPIIAHANFAFRSEWLTHCTDATCSGEPPFSDANTVRLPVRQGIQPLGYDLALDFAGNPTISDVMDIRGDAAGHTNVPLGTQLALLRCNDPSCIGGGDTYSVVDEGLGGTTSSYTSTSVAIDEFGFPVIGYFASGLLRVAHCNDPGCAGGDESISTVAGIAGVYPHIPFVDIALDSAGVPVIAYSAGPEAGPATLSLIHCGDRNCLADSTNVAIGTVDAGSLQPFSLALDGHDRVVLAFTDNAGQLMLIGCNDTNCVGGDEITIRVAERGHSPSMVLDADGNPVISYSDAAVDAFPTNPFSFPGWPNPSSVFHLNVAHCQDRVCAGESEGTAGLVPVPPAPDSNLPATGSNRSMWIWWAGMLVISGSVLALTARRRSEA